jgi:hypothetical protein
VKIRGRLRSTSLLQQEMLSAVTWVSKADFQSVCFWRRAAGHIQIASRDWYGISTELINRNQAREHARISSREKSRLLIGRKVATSVDFIQ